MSGIEMVGPLGHHSRKQYRHSLRGVRNTEESGATGREE